MIIRLYAAYTVGSKTIRTLAIIHVVFLWLDWQFLSYCLKQYKPKDHDLIEIYLIKLH